MTGQMKNYKEYMAQIYSPISLYTMPYTVDMRELRKNAEKKGVAIAELSEAEKNMFLVKNSLYKG